MFVTRGSEKSQTGLISTLKHDVYGHIGVPMDGAAAASPQDKHTIEFVPEGAKKDSARLKPRVKVYIPSVARRRAELNKNRRIELADGSHTIRVQVDDGTVWEKTFNLNGAPKNERIVLRSGAPARVTARCQHPDVTYSRR